MINGILWNCCSTFSSFFSTFTRRWRSRQMMTARLLSVSTLDTFNYRAHSSHFHIYIINIHFIFMPEQKINIWKYPVSARVLQLHSLTKKLRATLDWTFSTRFIINFNDFLRRMLLVCYYPSNHALFSLWPLKCCCLEFWKCIRYSSSISWAYIHDNNDYIESSERIEIRNKQSAN